MPHIGIIFVTVFEDDESVFPGLQAGGRGYILKDADPEEIVKAIRMAGKATTGLLPLE